MFCAYLTQFTLNEPYANAFLNRLDNDGNLLALCGLDRAPSEGAYCRFKKKLLPHEDTIQSIIAAVFLECGDEIERLREAGMVPNDKPPLGHALSMDSTDIMAWARPERKDRKSKETKPSKDGDARWGHRTVKNHRCATSEGKSRRSVKIKKSAGTEGDTGNSKAAKDELFFGYSANIVVDANHGLPLFSAVRPANASDVVIMVQDLDDCLALYNWLGPRYFLADKGYDSLDNIIHLVRLGIIPVIAVRLPTKDKKTGKRLHDGIYDGKGRPTCIGGQPMTYVRSDPERGHQFQCPPGGCHLQEKVSFSGYCDSEHYEMPEGRLLRIVGLLPRCSEAWKAEYKKRTTSERYNSSDKHSRLLDTHRYFCIEKVLLHSNMSMLSYLATALAHLKADDYAHMRHMRVKLPRAPKGRLCRECANAALPQAA